MSFNRFSVRGLVALGLVSVASGLFGCMTGADGKKKFLPVALYEQAEKVVTNDSGSTDLKALPEGDAVRELAEKGGLPNGTTLMNPDTHQGFMINEARPALKAAQVAVDQLKKMDLSSPDFSTTSQTATNEFGKALEIEIAGRRVVRTTVEAKIAAAKQNAARLADASVGTTYEARWTRFNVWVDDGIASAQRLQGTSVTSTLPSITATSNRAAN